MAVQATLLELAYDKNTQGWSAGWPAGEGMRRDAKLARNVTARRHPKIAQK